MRKYQLTRAADRDLSGIYLHTHREFGEQQADSYFESLDESLSRLGENPSLGVDINTVREGYRRFIHKEHAIYYKLFRPGILIVRILGPGMAAERHLP